MYSRYEVRSTGGFRGLSRPPSPDLIAVVATLFGAWTLQFFSTTAAIPAALRLQPVALTGPWLWQLITYAFVGWGAPDIWFLLELLILYWFAADVFSRLGRARFWRLVLVAASSAGLVAVGLHLLLSRVLQAWPVAGGFPLIQGQRVLLTIVTVAFAVLYAEATVLLFFVLPVPARLFVWLPVLLGFVAFLATRDLPGFVGLCTAVAVAWGLLRRRPHSTRGAGWWSSITRIGRSLRMRRLRRRSSLRAVDDDTDETDLTIN